jgi:quercetin dioxygenase-like cupin family protein
MTISAEGVTKRILLDTAPALVFVLNLAPDQEIPPHQHPGSEVIITVLDGVGTILADGNPIQVQAMDMVHLKGEEALQVTNGSHATLSLLVTLAPKPGDQRYAQSIH